jgi:hypothetical protein
MTASYVFDVCDTLFENAHYILPRGFNVTAVACIVQEKVEGETEYCCRGLSHQTSSCSSAASLQRAGYT